MDVLRLHIPYGFIRARVRMDWRDVRFGLVNELLDPGAPVELAVDLVLELPAPPAALCDLAGARKDEPALELVEQLADLEPGRPESDIRDLWLYLVLAWIYEHRDEFPDPLGTVEVVHADFDYPEQIATFVRYQPGDDWPDLGSREANQRRLFERWKRYLDEAARARHPQ